MISTNDSLDTKDVLQYTSDVPYFLDNAYNNLSEMIDDAIKYSKEIIKNNDLLKNYINNHGTIFNEENTTNIDDNEIDLFILNALINASSELFLKNFEIMQNTLELNTEDSYEQRLNRFISNHKFKIVPFADNYCSANVLITPYFDFCSVDDNTIHIHDKVNPKVEKWYKPFNNIVNFNTNNRFGFYSKLVDVSLTFNLNTFYDHILCKKVIEMSNGNINDINSYETIKENIVSMVAVLGEIIRIKSNSRNKFIEVFEHRFKLCAEKLFTDPDFMRVRRILKINDVLKTSNLSDIVKYYKDCIFESTWDNVKLIDDIRSASVSCYKSIIATAHEMHDAELNESDFELIRNTKYHDFNTSNLLEEYCKQAYKYHRKRLENANKFERFGDLYAHNNFDEKANEENRATHIKILTNFLSVACHILFIRKNFNLTTNMSGYRKNKSETSKYFSEFQRNLMWIAFLTEYIHLLNDVKYFKDAAILNNDHYITDNIVRALSSFNKNIVLKETISDVKRFENNIISINNFKYTDVMKSRSNLDSLKGYTPFLHKSYDENNFVINLSIIRKELDFSNDSDNVNNDTCFRVCDDSTIFKYFEEKLVNEYTPKYPAKYNLFDSIYS